MEPVNLERLIAEVRPADTLPLSALADAEVGDDPILAYGNGDVAVDIFENLAAKLAYGSAVVISGLPPAPAAEEPDHVEKIARANDFRYWTTGSCPDGARVWVKSAWTGDTNGTHRPYLFEAINRADGPVLELGSGPSSTPHLHLFCWKRGLKLVTLETSEEWFEKVKHFESHWHHLEFAPSIIDSPHLLKDWGVVFVDHAPGETRGDAMELARNRCEFIVLHDSEELGYGLEPILSTFRYRRDFRKERPWTTLVSERTEVWK